MRRLPVAAFVTLAAATIGAFFVIQHLKVSTPLLAGFPAPYPAAINPINGQICKGQVDHRRMRVSFYLLNRSDDVGVDIVDPSGALIDTLASGVHMTAGRHPRRRLFVWNGRTSTGVVAPDGTYFVRVLLIHQNRSVLISNSAGALPVTVETVSPHPRVTAVTPDLIPRAGVSRAAIHYTGNARAAGRVLVYRTDLSGPPRLVKSFFAPRGGSAHWDGTLVHSVPAPQGTYLIGLVVTDKACNTGFFPAEHPPVAGTTAHAGVTVRYLAAQPPLIPVPAGGTATVYVDARRHGYAWALRAAGTKKVLASGRTRAFALHVRLPAGAAATGLYELALRYGSHRTLVPIVGTPAGAAHARVLVVLPALTWQGVNPVDDNGDGIPNTLSAGYPILLARPLVDGLPAGWGSLTGLLTRLHKDRRSYALSTDLALASGTGPPLAGHAGVVLAGDERWVPPALATALRGYVAAGVTCSRSGSTRCGARSASLPGVRATRAPPGRPTSSALTPGRVLATHGTLILGGKDQLGLFTQTSGAFRGFKTYQPFTSVSPPLTIASAAGTTTASSAIIGFRLGRGVVIEVGLPGFGSALAHNPTRRRSSADSGRSSRANRTGPIPTVTPGMAAYLKRLVSSLAAYQVADVVSKLLAVLLLPVYTRYISPAGYGVVELLANGVILISIIARFGMIESFLRFYFTDEDPVRRDALVRRTASFLLVATTIVAAVLAVFAGPLSQIVLSHRDTTTFLVAVLGLWSFTNLELAYGLLRVDERLRTYVTATLINVVLTVVASIVLVVGLGDGARGLLLANYGVSTVVLLGLWWTLRRPPRPAPRAGRADGDAAAFRAAHRARRGLGLCAQHRRSLLRLPRPQPGAGRSLLDRGQAGRGGGLHRARLSVRVATAGVFDPGRCAGCQALRSGHHVLPVRERLGGGRTGPARALDPATARRPCLRRRLPGVALGRPGLGAVRHVGHLSGHRRAGQGHDAQLPGRPGRTGGQRHPAARPRPVTGHRRRRASPSSGPTRSCSPSCTC